MALISTVGAVDANSYASLAEANTYFADGAYISAWEDTDETQANLLISATRRLDQESYAGYRMSYTQALKWPRGNVYLDGLLIPSDTIPQRLKDAVFEMALSLAGSNILEQSELANFKSLQVGPVSLEMNQPVQSGSLPAQVARLLKELRTSSGGVAMVRA
jgi:hypothetical protein